MNPRSKSSVVLAGTGAASVLMWKPDVVGGEQRQTVWERLREYAAGQSGPFTPQEALSWFRRHSSSEVNDRTVRTHIRGACWNVGDRSQFSSREPFLTKLDRGVFRRATSDELERWRARDSAGSTAEVATPVASTTRGAAAPREDPSTTQLQGSSQPSDEWHTEANVQASLVTALAAEGWRILSVANTATKEHGIDVVATRGDQTVGIEVKGFPSRNYADPARSSEKKRTSPSTQAGHWFSQAVLAAMRLRGKEPSWRSVIALPDFPRYRALYSETVGPLTAAGIEVWWVEASGAFQSG